MSCEHDCCGIPENGYHVHTEVPDRCQRCSVVTSSAGEATIRVSESVTLAEVVADVVASVAPQIPDLPAAAELADLVAHHALAVYAASLDDADVQALDGRTQRTVLAARVGLALAFPV
jgi:hypothetical protein